MASELGVLGTISWVEVLKVWMPNVMWVQTSVLREKPGVVIFFFQNICHFAGVWVYRKIVSLPLLPILVWSFSLFTCCVEVAQLVSDFLSEGLVPYIAVGLVCLWEEEPAQLPS